MWTANVTDVGRKGVQRYLLRRDDAVASFAEVVEAWRSDRDFRAWFNALLADTPFVAFRWETPPVTVATASQPFEFVLLDSPGLACTPDPDAFAEHFQRDSAPEVLSFPNLGADAIMIVPRPIGAPSSYGHVAAFVRHAPEAQRQSLWQAVGEAMARRLSANPVWLSTAGGGVSWLHVRLDDRPKYYAFAPYTMTR